MIFLNLKIVKLFLHYFIKIRAPVLEPNMKEEGVLSCEGEVTGDAGEV